MVAESLMSGHSKSKKTELVQQVGPVTCSDGSGNRIPPTTIVGGMSEDGFDDSQKFESVRVSYERIFIVREN